MAQNSSSGIIQDSGSSNFKIFFKISWFQETWITLDELYGAIFMLVFGCIGESCSAVLLNDFAG